MAVAHSKPPPNCRYKAATKLDISSHFQSDPKPKHTHTHTHTHTSLLQADKSDIIETSAIAQRPSKHRSIHHMMLDGGDCTPSAAEPFSRINTVQPTRKKKSKNKRRFSDEQTKSLETMFETETRLEPRKKMQLAKELGLQPRQVAIWFQNKRARWKSKQLERDYSILRANYNSMASRFEALNKEKQALVAQLQKLNNMMQQNPVEEGQCCGQNTAERSSELEVKPSLSLERSEHGLGVLSDEDSSIKTEYFGLHEEPHLMNMVEPADGSMTSQEDWGSLDSDGLFDQSSSDCQWWDFWA